MPPKFSLIMPVYNVEKYLRRSISSVLNQSMTDYELILVDDGSPDGCPQICDEFASAYPRVRVIHQANAGLSGARNAGFAAAGGEYVMFPDGDDVLQPDTLERFSRVLEEYPDARYVFSDYQSVTEGDELRPAGYDDGTVIYGRDEIQEMFLKRKVRILAPDSLINAGWYRENGLAFEDNPYGEDQLFIWKALLCADRVYHVRKPLYNYLSRPGSIMTASDVQKILSAYPFFVGLGETCSRSENAAPLVRQFLLPSLVRGVLHSSAKILPYRDYRTVLAAYDSDRYLKVLRHYPSAAVRALAWTFAADRHLFYLINRFL